jgi:hypothetical protein
MNKEQAVADARAMREETLRELKVLIKDLQNDYDRLTKAKEHDDSDGMMTATQGNKGYYLSQHCLRYEQTMRAGWRMEEYARIAQWIKE